MTCSRCGASSKDKPPVKRFEVVWGIDSKQSVLWGIDPKQGVLFCERCAKEAKKPKPEAA